MTLKFSVLEKYLNYLLLFLFPTQLALHFWPEFAFVYGIRIDYLSPAIYLVDILFVGLFLNWIAKNYKSFLSDVKRNKLLLGFLFVLVSVNILVSTSILATFYKWLRIIELTCLGYYLNKRTGLFSKTTISKILFFSLVTFCLIGLVQIFSGGSLNGFFYWLGERNFTTHTPGISLVNIFGKNYLRIYSTFSHPNSFAGFLGAYLIFTFFNRPKINKYLYICGLFIVFISFIATFSLGAYVAAIVAILSYIVLREYIFNKNISRYFLIFVFIFSLYLLIMSRSISDDNLSLPQTIKERVDLNVVAGKIIQEKWFFGIGLNSFFIEGARNAFLTKNVWLLQPIHNIYLLTFVETGIVGLTLLYFLLNKLAQKIVDKKDAGLTLCFLFILVTSIVDHYWITIYQNMTLLSLFAAISSREK